MQLTQSTIAFFLVALPWLNPFAPGPTPAVVPWLISLGASAGLLLLAAQQATSRNALSVQSFAQRWANPVAGAWLFAGLVSSVLALLQYFNAGEALGTWLSQNRPGEAFANLRQRNQFASLTNIALIALLWFGGRDRPGWARPWLIMLAACLLGIGNAASSSRTGLLQLMLIFVMLAVWGAWRRPVVLRALLAATLAYALGLLLLPWLAGMDLATQGLFARLRAGDQLCASRLTLWSNVLQLIAAKPWFGWGWGELDYAHYITLYDGPRFCEILDNAHHLPLHLAVELGIPVALLVCGGVTWWVLRQRPWRETEPTRQLAWAVLAVIFLHSLLEYPLWYGPFQMAAGLSVALLLQRRVAAPGPSEYRSNRAQALICRALAAIILIASSGYAWEYHRVSQIYLAPESRNAAWRDDTMKKIRDTRLFRDEVRFAELGTTPLTRASAQWTFETASALLHYSPEPRVIERVIESAVLLGYDEEAMKHLARYRAAFAADHARWLRGGAL